VSDRSKDPRLFDHLVGAGAPRGKHGNVERLGRLQVSGGARTLDARWQFPPSPGELLAIPYPRREAIPVIHRISELKPCEKSLPTVISAFGTPVRTATPHVDQNKVPNNLLVNEPSLSTQRIGGSSGR
jgi:hypothetical protein